MRFLKGLFKGKHIGIPAFKKKFSNVPEDLQAYIKKHGRLPLSMIKSYLSNTGQPIGRRFPKTKQTLFDVKPQTGGYRPPQSHIKIRK